MSFAAVVERLQKLENPYPGLRPFETQESHLFFGRDQQVAELVGRLERNRFVAVLGVSGSGKSSLVRAGLIPALERGRVSEAGQRWRMVVTRPAGAPFESLSADLGKTGLDASPLKHSSHGLIEIARQLAGDESLLVVIDQFEELFRYKDFVPSTEEARRRRDAAAADAAEFVQLVLAASRHQPPVYIVLTMRSDYLGDCAEFRDLPETLNDCQYLVPRMTREQRKEAIEVPLGRVMIAPSLVQRLLNDAGDEPDQLPILQHALMRTWSRWRNADPEQKRRIELEDYEAIGGFDGALNQHADELLAAVRADLAAIVFKRLTARGRNNRERRDPATLAELWAVCGAHAATQQTEVSAVIDHFRRNEATFLTPREGAIQPPTYIDITHESLIRQWNKLRDEWLPEEARSSRTFLDLVARAGNWKAKRGEVLAGLDFADALDWARHRNQSDAWAEHYANKEDLEAVHQFIQASQTKERRRRFQSIIVAAVFVLFIGVAAIAFYQRAATDRLRESSVVSKLLAESRFREESEPGTAMIFAAESVLRIPTVEGIRQLRRLVNEISHQVAQLPHGGSVSSVAFSPDGRLLATGSADRFARVFDVTSGKLVSPRMMHDAPVTQVAFSQNGRWLATAAANRASIFDATTGMPIRHVVHEGKIHSVVFSPDSEWVVTAGEDTTARLFKVADGNPVWKLPHEKEVESVVFSPDGSHVATGSDDWFARVFDVASRQEVSRLKHDGAVSTVAFSPDGRWVATGSKDTTARVFDAANGKEMASFQHSGPVTSVAFSGDGRRVASGSEDKILRVFDVMTQRELWNSSFGEAIESVTFSHDGQWLAAGSDDMFARVFYAPTGEVVSTLRHGGAVVSVTFSPDGRRLATASDEDKSARVFEATGNEIARLEHQGLVRATAIGANELQVATGSADGTVQIFETTVGRLALRLPRKGLVNSVALSPDARWLAVGSDGPVARIFETESGKEVGHLDHQRGTVSSVSFSTDGRRIVTAGSDHTARVFETIGWKEVSLLPHDGPVISAVFSADGTLVATGTGGKDPSARVFNVASKKETWRVSHGGPVAWAAFSQDGRLVATASEDTFARVFDLTSGKEISRLKHQSVVRFVAFSLDGNRVTSGSDDRTARVFNTGTGEEIAQISLSGRVLETRFVDGGHHLLTLSRTKSGNALIVSRHPVDSLDLINEGCARLMRNLTETEWKGVGIDVPPHKTCANRP